MAEKSPETQYHISDSKILQNLLVENGWTKKPFSGLDMPNSFTERPLTKSEISALASTLNNLKTTFEANAVLNSLTRGDLVAEIGTTYTFKSLKELCVAMDQRDVKYPKSYLQQAGSSFGINFGAPRSLTKDKYEKLITALASIADNTATADAERGEIIRAAFNEKTSPSTLGITGTTLGVQKKDLLSSLPTTTETLSTQDNGVKEIKESLAEITPESLEKTINISEAIINKLPEGDTKFTLRGLHGAVIFDILRSAGHKLTLQNGQITIVPKPGTDVVNLQEKLQTLVNTKKLSLDTLKLGMLYSSPSFKTYSELKKIKDNTGKDIVDPKANPQDFIKYLKDLQGVDNKSGDIDTILESQAMLSGVNMQQAIKGFQDMGQIGKWIENNPNVLNAANASLNLGNTQSAPQSAPSVPSEPNNTLTGKLVKDGVTGGHVTGVVGDATKGLMNGIGDIMSLGKGDPLATLGIGAALIYGIYKAFGKFGFLGGLGALFGAGAMNNIEKIMGRFGVDIGETAGKAKIAAEEATENARAAVTGTTALPSTNNTQQNAPSLTPSQQGLRDKIMTNGSLGTDIDKLATVKNSKYPGKLDDYVKFIETDLKDIPLSKLFTTDHKESIFFDNFSTSFSMDSKLSGKMLKRVLREYLTGSSVLTGTADKFGETEKNNFLTQHSIAPIAIQNKKLSDILESVHKVRAGVALPVAMPTTSTIIPSGAPTTAPTTQKNTFKIAGVDKITGNNIETSVNAPVFDASGNPYNNTATKLKTDSKGVIFAPAGSVVKLGSSVIQRNNVEHIEVEYAGEKIYVAITHLKS